MKVGDYYKQHPEERKEIVFKIYRNDGLIDEMTEVEANDTGTKRMFMLEGGEIVKEKKRIC